VPWLEKICDENPELVPNGFDIVTPQSTWQNGWSFMAAGVPSFEVSAGGPGYGEKYHSTYENQDVVDWELTAKMSKLFMRLNRFIDKKQLPYDFVGRADDLVHDHFAADELTAAGVSASRVDALEKAVAAFRKTSAKFGASKAAILGVRGPAQRNRAMLAAARKVLKGMTALDAWDYTAYPHEQTLWDVQYIDAALEALRADPVDPAAAIEALTNVGINWNGVVFSPSVYRYDLTRHDPDYERVTWGALGKLINYFDMTPVMAWVEDGKYDKAIATLETMRATDSRDLGIRVENMTKALNGATSTMKNAL
jgi:hypothetical protein